MRPFGNALANRIDDGDGSDIFCYTDWQETARGAGHDVIGDFVEGFDRIDLCAIDVPAWRQRPCVHVCRRRHARSRRRSFKKSPAGSLMQ
jgi:hypothetical protein